MIFVSVIKCIGETVAPSFLCAKTDTDGWTIGAAGVVEVVL